MLNLYINFQCFRDTSTIYVEIFYKSTIINLSFLNSSTSRFLGQYNHFKNISLYRSSVLQKEISMKNYVSFWTVLLAVQFKKKEKIKRIIGVTLINTRRTFQVKRWKLELKV